MYQSKPISSVGSAHGSSFVHDSQLELSGNCMGPNNGPSSSNNPNMTSRQRLRWTHELHERFVDAVTQLGGPDSEYFFFSLLFKANCVEHNYFLICLSIWVFKVAENGTVC